MLEHLNELGHEEYGWEQHNKDLYHTMWCYIDGAGSTAAILPFEVRPIEFCIVGMRQG